jgi:hypothetical protein
MTAFETFSVVGYWADSNERYVEFFRGATVRDVEDQMLGQAAREAGDFRIAGTMLGEQYRADLYTAFVDPDDEANDEREDLQPVIDGLGVAEWTIVGIVTSTARHDGAWNERTGGERYLGHEMALSPRIAEDLARMAVRERGGFELTVCGVFEGVKNRCESFAFSNHDEAPAK